MQAVSAAHIWNLGQQVSSSKAPAGRTTASDAELFAIKLGIAKTTSMAIEHIILITDSLDPFVHPGQAHSLAVCSALRLFFSQGYSYRIDFWDCPSKAKWSITMWLTPGYLLDLIQQLPLTSCTLKVSFLAWTLGEHCLIVPPSKVDISSLSETGINDFYSLATPKMVVGFLILASRSHYMPGWLEPFSTMLPLGSTDSAFSLQSVPSVHVAIARWKYDNTFLQTALGLPIVP